MRDLSMYNEKVNAITAVNGARGSEPCKNMCALANIFIAEIREDNDNAVGSEVIRNQGKIEAFKMMIDAIAVGIPIK